MKTENNKALHRRFIFRYAGHMAFVVMLLAIFSLAGCSTDEFGSVSDMEVVPDGYVRAEINLSVMDKEQINTRATEAQESHIDNDNVWILVFDGTTENAKLMQRPIKASYSGGKLFALLYATAETRSVYIVANLYALQQTYLSTAMNFVEGTTTLAQLNAGLVAAATDIPAAGLMVNNTNPVLMCSSPPILCKAEDGGTTGITSLTGIMKRLAARIDVVVKPGIVADFSIQEVRLINGAKKTDILPLSAISVNNGGTQVYSTVANVVTNVAGGGKAIEAQVYLFQNRGKLANNTPNPTSIVVRGLYKGIAGYYRIDILNAADKTPYDIESNKIYTVSISDIENAGYMSESEAAANTASNGMKYTVTVSDQEATDILSNGEYYLAVSNSDFIDYSDDTSSDISAFTIYYNAPSSVSTATISALGTGLTFVAGLGLTTVNGVSGQLSAPNSGAHIVDVRVRLASNFVDGTIQVRMGNLFKTINLKRYSPVSFAQTVLSDYNNLPYVGAEVSSGSLPWLGVSTSPGIPSAAIGKVINPVGGIFIHIFPNETPAVRRGEIYVSREGNGGRARVRIKQSEKP